MKANSNFIWCIQIKWQKFCDVPYVAGFAHTGARVAVKNCISNVQTFQPSNMRGREMSIRRWVRTEKCAAYKCFFLFLQTLNINGDAKRRLDDNGKQTSFERKSQSPASRLKCCQKLIFHREHWQIPDMTAPKIMNRYHSAE